MRILVNHGRKYSVALLCSLSLAGCAAADAHEEGKAASDSGSPRETVTVARGELAPVLSGQTALRAGGSFVLSSPGRGVFTPQVKPGAAVKQGDVVGSVGATKVLAPAAGKIRGVAAGGQEVPAHYPVVEVDFTGFLVELDATSFVRVVPPSTALTGKFQVVDGGGPQDCLAVVRGGEVSAGGSGAAAEHGSEGPADAGAQQSLQCLLPVDAEVQPGALTTVVITGKTRPAQLLLPVDAVAGRLDKGSVTLVRDGREELRSVRLGATDGARIEILEGLAEGDTVAAGAPMLDPRA